MATPTKKRQYPNPAFATSDEEAAYWNARSPLLEGYEGKVEQKPARRTSFLSIRMSGRELEVLRQAATREGIGPTTLARKFVIQSLLDKQVTLDDLREEVQQLRERLKKLERTVAAR